MFQAIKNIFKRDKCFLDTKEFQKRVDAILWDRLASAPTIWGIGVMLDTCDDVEAWMHKNQRAITEEEYISILMQHIENCMDRQLPPNFMYRTLREKQATRFEPKL